MNNDDDNGTMSKIDRKYAQAVVLQRHELKCAH